MKILLYGINYWPEPTGIGKYTGDLARELALSGHEVHVITAPPYYPQWQVAAGYSSRTYIKQVCDEVTVIRCPLWVPKEPGGIRRILHLFSFALSSFPALLASVPFRPDIVWVCAPALACTPGALILARLCGARAWLHIQDFEIDVAFDTGLLKGPFVRMLASRVERWIYRRFDTVSSISGRMLSALRDKGVHETKIRKFPNWVDVDVIRPLLRQSTYRDELGIKAHETVALFSGTLGAKQGLHVIVESARLLTVRCTNIRFVICGSGALESHLRESTRSLANVQMIPLQPVERLADLLGLADIHMLPQDPEVSDLVMPSKLTAMLSSGRPIVTNAKHDGEIGRIVSQCGVLAEPSDPESFAKALEDLAGDPALRKKLGRAARAYAEEHLGRTGILRTFMFDCQELIARQA